MADERQRPKPASADPDLRMETELEADPMLKLSEGRASRLQIRGRRSRDHRDRRCGGVRYQPALATEQ